MKAFFKTKCVAAVIIIAALNVGRAQQADSTKEIEQAIRDYLTAMSARDVKGLQAVLDKRFVAIEAADKNAKVHLVDTASEKELLPPKGNNDWDKDNIRLSAVEVKISETHPSVAMASFTLTVPMSAQKVANLEAALKDLPAEFNDAQRKAATKIIADRAVHNSMFAMLARQDGHWKIVSMSFPK
jgi:hypothetical protein